jgi:hypothetical protein
MAEVNKIRENYTVIEEQTDYLTDYILAALLEQMKYNMYPKRAVIGIKSP